jgi:hypothetical protein
VRSCQLFFKIYIFTDHIVLKKFLEDHERAFRGQESTFRGRDSAFRGLETVAGALLLSTKSKRKHKLSDIEAKDRNETKTF